MFENFDWNTIQTGCFGTREGCCVTVGDSANIQTPPLHRGSYKPYLTPEHFIVFSEIVICPTGRCQHDMTGIIKV